MISGKCHSRIFSTLLCCNTWLQLHSVCDKHITARRGKRVEIETFHTLLVEICHCAKILHNASTVVKVTIGRNCCHFLKLRNFFATWGPRCNYITCACFGVWQLIEPPEAISLPLVTVKVLRALEKPSFSNNLV